MQKASIRALEPSDSEFVNDTVCEAFASNVVVSRGKVHDCLKLPGYIAEIEREPAGLILYSIDSMALEVVALVSRISQQGIGRALLQRVSDLGIEQQLSRCWLVTTNNNHNAINFYRHVGWHLKAIHEGAVEESRQLSPLIPLVDDRQIPIQDEWEFEQILRRQL